jgi:hypothetical protein
MGQELSNKYIKLPKQELSVEEYLGLIEKSTGYKLIYSSAIIKSRSILVKKDSLCLREILDTIFINQSITPILKENLLILAPQNENTFKTKKIKVTGTVLDIQTKIPISYASVFVPNESIGVITNNDGRFEIYLPGSSFIDTLMVSCLGYNIEKISSDCFLKGPVNIYLDPNKFITLSQIIVRPKDPKALVLKAINHKSMNYSNKPALLTGFFREATRQDNKYTSLSEAIFEVYKTSYSSVTEDLIKLKKGRLGSNTENSRLVNLIVHGGLYYNLQLDIMKYGINFLDPEQMGSYEYNFDRQANYAGRQTYIINFKYYQNQPNIGYDGTLFIDSVTFAVVRAEFAISPYSMYYAKEQMIKNVPIGYQVKPKYAKYEIEYRIYDGCWNLMHGQSKIGFTAKKKWTNSTNGFMCELSSTSEFVVTRTETNGYEKIKYKDAAKPDDILYQQISGFDKEFWGNETIIIPEEPLLKTIEKLKLQEENEKTKLVSSKTQ